MTASETTSGSVAIPSSHRLLQQAGFLGHVGGIGVDETGSAIEVCLAPTAEHLNPNGTVHGGVLLTLLDFTLGVSAERALGGGSGRHPATISLTTQFIGAADGRSLLRGTAEVLRQTRSLSFMEGRITSGDRLVATAAAVFKNPPPN